MTTGPASEPVVRRALERLAHFAHRDVPLAPLTTYRVGGPAAILARPTSVAELLLVGRAANETGLPVLVVGRGSNLLVADEGFAGIAVVLADLVEASLVDLHGEHGEHGEHGGRRRPVRFGAAVALPVAARRSVAAGLTGFEWAVGVPGSIGGAVRMNAGGHGSDIAAALRRVELVDLHLAQRSSVEAAALGLRFRGSDLADHQVVVTAELVLAEGDREQSERELDEIVRWRRTNQPGGQNAGSVFVNPVPGEIPAGRLIDEAGLRGLRLGSAHVSDKHANFIQADEGGTAADVRALIELVRDRVEAQSGFRMRSEVRLVGFGPEPAREADPAADGAR